MAGLLIPTEKVDLDSDYGFLDQLNPLSTSDEEERVAFGQAIQNWNKHNYKKAYEAFDKFSKQYPQSPWKSEAVLHMGCEARFNGRYSEARTLFEQVISDNKNSKYLGAKKMFSKAQSRLAVLNVMENNPKKAKEGFKALNEQSEDWRLRTYASHWLQRINVQEKSDNLLDCGTWALSTILESKGNLDASQEVLKDKPGKDGFSIQELIALANNHGESASAIFVQPEFLESLPLPAILQIDRSENGGKGHYWIMEAFTDKSIVVFDPQMERLFTQTAKELTNEWQGNAIVFTEKIV